ncbi:MAG: hypothetical protein J2P28_02830 [Actinobacteria bacterium]|nr:hypothetical protein [Actinomycetota bacterium]
MTDNNVHPFAKWQGDAWPYRYRLEIHVGELHGGVPRNPDVVRAWLRAKAGWTDEMEIEAEVQRIFALDPERADIQVADDATKELADRHVNGFARDSIGLYIGGRQVKAGIKESANSARGVNLLPARWGTTSRGVLSFVAEHIMVVEDRLYLGRTEHDDLHTRFVQTRWGSGITVEEVCYDVDITATVIANHHFTDEQWAMIWLTGEQQGLGASRSQGFGRYQVTGWDPA